MTGPATLTELQDAIATFAEQAWPGLTIEVEALALVEEVGELVRCIVKRAHGNRGTAADWTAELRREAGDALCVLLNVAHLERFDLFTAAREQFDALVNRDLDHDPVTATGLTDTARLSRPDRYPRLTIAAEAGPDWLDAVIRFVSLLGDPALRTALRPDETGEVIVPASVLAKAGGAQAVGDRIRSHGLDVCQSSGNGIVTYRLTRQAPR